MDFDLEITLEHFLDPVIGSNAPGKVVEGIVNIHVDDVLLCGTKYFKEHVISRLKEDFLVGSEAVEKVLFCGQKVEWKDRGTKQARIVVYQNHKVKELTEVIFPSNLSDDKLCDNDTHTRLL